jgi:hypothetical protein
MTQIFDISHIHDNTFITVHAITEKADGSAICSIELSGEALRFLIEFGFNRFVLEALQKNTEDNPV